MTSQGAGVGSAVGAVRRKRRPKGVCPNPLFVRWLEECRDEAMSNGSKTSYTYSKALNSVKRYPLPLSSGQEAKILQHIGDKIAKMLDKRIVEHLKNGGTMEDLHCSAPPVSPPPPAHKPDCSHPQLTTDTNTDTQSDLPPQKRRRSTKEYVPAYRSGPYAILVALYTAEMRPGYVGYLLKNELQDAATPYCDASFTVPKQGTQYYTAWYSLSNLLKKDLVRKWSSPARYSLTESGITLAARLLEVQSSVTGEKACEFERESATRTKENVRRSPSLVAESPAAKRILSATTTTTTSSSLSSSSSSSSAILRPIDNVSLVYNPEDLSLSPPSAFSSYSFSSPPSSPAVCSPRVPADGSVSSCRLLPQFSYIDSDGDCVHSKDQAAVEISEDLGVGFLVKCNKILLESSSVRYLLDKKRPSDGTMVYAYVHNDDAPNYCPLESASPVGHHDSVSTFPAVARSDDACVLLDSDSDCELRCQPPSHSELASSSDSEGDVLPLSRRLKLLSSLAAQPKSHHSKHVSSEGSDECSFEHRTMSVHVTSARDTCSSQLSVSSKRNSVKGSKIARQSSNTATKTTSYQTFSATTTTAAATAMSSSSHNTAAAITSSIRPASSSKTTSYRSTSGTSSTSITSSIHPTSVPTTSSSTAIIATCSQSSQCSVDLSCPLSVLSPGEYEVVLCVDNSESTASRQSVTYFRGLLLEELNKNGVKFSVRKLNVGDFLWVAVKKNTTQTLPGQLRQQSSDGAVLEYIVERKRMDDLASSILDRRFHEQKHRLHHCGVRHPIYLVEEYGDAQHFRLPKSSLQQAVTNTQVIDGFFIKQALDIRESVAYLTVMTRYLQSYYSDKTVKIYPVETIQELTKLWKEGKIINENKSVVCSMPLSSFNEASIKTKACTVSEMFAKHLIQVPQSSAARARAILEQYPTVTCLWQAYNQCTTDKEREELLANIRAGDTKRKLGGSLSKSLFSLYYKSPQT